MRKRTILAIALLLAAAWAWSEEELANPIDLFPNALGLSGSLMGTYGLSYQRWLDPFGFQVTAMGISFPATVPSWSVNAQATFQYALDKEVYASWLSNTFYGLLTAAYVCGQEPLPVDDPDTPELDTMLVPGPFTQHVLVGIGIGIEPVLFRHISLPSEFGFYGDLIGRRVMYFLSAAIRYRF
jgi:hypothetical protein